MGACQNIKPWFESKFELDVEENIELKENELKIDLYPRKRPRYTFDKTPLSKLITRDVLAHSLNPDQSLAYIDSNVPLLNGFYTAHTNHYPIRIKPDDIWLLIVQAFSHHVNANSEKLRHYFVNFDGKQKLIVKTNLSSIEQIDRKILENFSEQINEQMKKYLGDELIDILTPDFSTSNYDSKIVCKISIMGAFKQYFNYEMFICGCGIPYIILEGTAQDYKQIISKAKELKKYEFDWYINRIIPLVEKMVEAKEDKVDIDFFKNIIQKKEITETKYGPSGLRKWEVKYDYISGWFLKFFAYLNRQNFHGEYIKFKEDRMKVEDFKYLADQMLIVPFTIVDEVNKVQYDVKYKVGFVGCDQNENKQVFPIQGWIVSPSTKEERERKL